MADTTLDQLNNPYQEELMGLNRQRALANMLLQQNLQAPKGQMVSGRYVAPNPLQYLGNMAQIVSANQMASSADKEQIQLAENLRKLSAVESQNILQALKGTSAIPGSSVQPMLAGKPMRDDETGALYPPIVNKEQPAIPGSNMAAYAEALKGRTPVSQGMATLLQKQLVEGPEWKEAKIPQPDGSELFGYVNVKSPNPISTFIQGGTKPPYTPLEGANYTFNTGMQPPGANSQPNKPVKPGAPIQIAPTQTVPTQPSSNQTLPPTVNRGNLNATLMSSQTDNQPITLTGNTVPVSAMNRPGMSPKAQQEANRDVYVASEKQRQEDLRTLPGALEQANTAIKTIDEMIGDARLNDKNEIVYQKYDPVSKKWVEGKTPHGGFENYVGATWLPGMRFIEGSDAASFEPLYKGIKGQAFLEAFARLKGGGQITEIEGQKATEALLKLDKAQNEKDFIKYAREFQENLQRGMELAKNKAGVSKEYKSPVNQPLLRWNPQTNSWVTQ